MRKYFKSLLVFCLLAIPAQVFALNATLTWTDASDNEDGFKVEKKVDAGTFAEIGTTAANVAIYTDAISAGATTCYRVRAFNLAGLSGYSNEACATVPTIPAGPTGANVTVTLQMQFVPAP